jgi:hypothetical protein
MARSGLGRPRQRRDLCLTRRTGAQRPSADRCSSFTVRPRHDAPRVLHYVQCFNRILTPISQACRAAARDVNTHGSPNYTRAERAACALSETTIKPASRPVMPRKHEGHPAPTRASHDWRGPASRNHLLGGENYHGDGRPPKHPALGRSARHSRHVPAHELDDVVLALGGVWAGGERGIADARMVALAELPVLF